jgi:hypothetical protein
VLFHLAALEGGVDQLALLFGLGGIGEEEELLVEHLHQEGVGLPDRQCLVRLLEQEPRLLGADEDDAGAVAEPE